MKYNVNSSGFYGDFGGAYIPEMLFSNIDELNKNYLSIVEKDSFEKEFNYYLKKYGDTFISSSRTIRFLFTLLGVFLIGTSIGIVFLYQSLSLVLSQFNHANIKLPNNLDKVISYFIVSPNMHKVHHHFVMPYTDSNYGNIFSFWDRMFGTHKHLDTSKIIYGVDTFFNKEKNQMIDDLLLRPFQDSDLKKSKTSSYQKK